MEDWGENLHRGRARNAGGDGKCVDRSRREDEVSYRPALCSTAWGPAMDEDVKRALGLALWGKLCEAIEFECREANNASEKRRLAVEREPLTLSVRDFKTGKTLDLSYQEALTCINCRQSGKPEFNITLRAERTPDPVLTPVLNGLPWITQDLAVQLVTVLMH